jgi:hypothetical protein
MNEKVCDYDFLDILDCEILSATQLIEQKIGSSQFRQIDFSDISDDELIQASADNVIPKSSVSNDGYQIEFSDISENELVQAAESAPTMQSTRFRQPVSSNEMAKIVGEKFAKKTVDKSVWAVTLFGEWRAERNVRCLSDPSLVYLDKPFAFMTDDELNSDDAFYLRPLDNYTADRWFSNVQVGINTLGSVVGKLCARAGFGFQTTHCERLQQRACLQPVWMSN